MRARVGGFVGRVLRWRWAPLVSYLLLVAMLALSFYLDRQDRRAVCERNAERDQALYELLTLRPLPKGTPPEVRAKVEHAKRVFARPGNCERLL